MIEGYLTIFTAISERAATATLMKPARSKSYWNKCKLSSIIFSKRIILYLIGLLLSLNCFSQPTGRYNGGTMVFDNYLLQGGYAIGKDIGFVSEKKSIMFAYDLENYRKGITASYSYGAFYCFGSDISVLYGNNLDIIFKPKIGIGMPILFGVFYGYNFIIGNQESHGTWSFELNVPITHKESNKNSKMLFGLIKNRHI